MTPLRLTRISLAQMRSTRKPCRSRTVANRVVLGLPVFGVLEAVDLDHEPARVADEVEIVASEGRLAANLEATLAETLEA